MLRLRTHIFSALLLLAIHLFVPTSAHAASGTLTSNQPCTLAAGATYCSVTVSYTFSGATKACVWTAGGTGLVSCSGNLTGNSFAWNWTTTSGTQFELRSHVDWPDGSYPSYTAGTLLASHSAYANPPAPASSGQVTATTCQLPGPSAPDRCTSTVNFTFANTPVACVWLAGGQLFACSGTGSGSVAFEWLTASGTTFELRAHSTWPANTYSAYSSAALLSTATAAAVPPAPPALAAQFISMSGMPATAVAGQQYAVAITMKNTGTTTWTSASGFALGSQNPQNTAVWGPSRAVLASSVATNGQATFNVNVTAPTQPGTYNFQWQMLRDSATWFGDKTTNLAVQVTNAPLSTLQFTGESYFDYAPHFTKFAGLVGNAAYAGAPSSTSFASKPAANGVNSEIFWLRTGPPPATGNTQGTDPIQNWTQNGLNYNGEEFASRTNCAGGLPFAWQYAFNQYDVDPVTKQVTTYRYPFTADKVLLEFSGNSVDITAGGSCGGVGIPYALANIPTVSYTIKVWATYSSGVKFYWQAQFDPPTNVANPCWTAGENKPRKAIKQSEAWWDGSWQIGSGPIGTDNLPTGQNVVYGRQGTFAKSVGWLWTGSDSSNPNWQPCLKSTWSW